jgi:two-component system sensor histidine kinase QseC
LEHGEPGHFLVVATERHGWDVTERRIHYALLAGIAIAIAIVIVLVQLVVRRAFTPLLQHGASIAALDTDNPPQHVGGDLPAELAPFAAAFHSGIDRLYDAIERERRFSRDIAHELRTPLAETRTAAEVALNDGAVSSLRAGLTTAIAATKRMQRSVDTLLAMVRVESGQESPAIDPLDLTTLVAAQVQMLQRLAESQGIGLRLQAPECAWTRSDVGILERILSNLLQNAVDYAPGRSTVECTIEHAGDGYSILIENAAPQLSAQDLSHFGTRFWRKPDEGSTAAHAGLGLALAFALARSLELKLEFRLANSQLQTRLGPFGAL